MKGFPLEFGLPLLAFMFGIYYGVGWLMSRSFRKRYNLPPEIRDPAASRRNRAIATLFAAATMLNLALIVIL